MRNTGDLQSSSPEGAVKPINCSTPRGKKKPEEEKETGRQEGEKKLALARRLVSPSRQFPGWSVELMAPLDLDKYVEIARHCKYLPENDLKVRKRISFFRLRVCSF